MSERFRRAGERLGGFLARMVIRHMVSPDYATQVAEEVHKLKVMCAALGYPVELAHEQFQQFAKTLPHMNVIEAIRYTRERIFLSTPKAN